jgi:hypothetical protein
MAEWSCQTARNMIIDIHNTLPQGQDSISYSILADGTCRSEVLRRQGCQSFLVAGQTCTIFLFHPGASHKNIQKTSLRQFTFSRPQYSYR